MSSMSKSEQNALFLQQRQTQFKQAALKAKQKGDIALAKKYLQQARGFAPMIEACHSGLPVDLSNVPAAPGSEAGGVAFVKEEVKGDSEKVDRNTMYKKLEQELIQQIRVRKISFCNFNFT